MAHPRIEALMRPRSAAEILIEERDDAVEIARQGLTEALHSNNPLCPVFHDIIAVLTGHEDPETRVAAKVGDVLTRWQQQDTYDHAS